MISRRQFVQFMPFLGAAATVACSDKGAPAASKPAVPAPAASAPAVPASPVTTITPPPSSASASLPRLDPKSKLAVSLGYVTDASQVDTAKYKNYVAGQKCANCTLYQGAANAVDGPCLVFQGSSVPAAAWCSSYVKKTV